MLNKEIRISLMEWADKYNDPFYFKEDPSEFPREFIRRGASLQDVEIAAVFAAHFAWGRRSMIVRDLERFFDFLEWKPLDYVMSGAFRNEPVSIHRTIKWSDTADICKRLQQFYRCDAVRSAEDAVSSSDGMPTLGHVRGGTTSEAQWWDEHAVRTGPKSCTASEDGIPAIGHIGGDGLFRSLEQLSTEQIRTMIFAQKEDKKAPNKKINMMRRWMVRDDGKVDFGLWKNSDKKELIIPLDVHVYAQATELGLTKRKQKDILTACEITDAFREIWPDDPAKGDFALFGHGVTKGNA